MHSTVVLFSATLKRPLSSSPRLFLGFLGSIALVCLLIASAWAYLGARWVLVFALVDVLALAWAAVWCVRHATDFERVSLSHDTLEIERQCANHNQRWELPRFYVRVALHNTRSSFFKNPRVHITAQGKTIVLGEFCHTAALIQLSAGLKLALKNHK